MKAIAKTRAELRALIESNTERITETGCWLWVGSSMPNEYGRVKMRGAYFGAHRISWTAFCGPIPVGLQVLHHCDIPCCVNPYHLFVGTQADNIADKNAKGKGNKGTANGRAKLTADDVLAIRADSRRHCDIAEQYGVKKSAIGYVKSRETWSHI